jgi:hypothetical protein
LLPTFAAPPAFFLPAVRSSGAISSADSRSHPWHDDDDDDDRHDRHNGRRPWAAHALLFSSFDNGVLLNVAARSFLHPSLADALLRERVVAIEDGIRSSAEFSPCNLPRTDAIDDAERTTRGQMRTQPTSAASLSAAAAAEVTTTPSMGTTSSLMVFRSRHCRRHLCLIVVCVFTFYAAVLPSRRPHCSIALLLLPSRSCVAEAITQLRRCRHRIAPLPLSKVRSCRRR